MRKDQAGMKLQLPPPRCDLRHPPSPLLGSPITLRDSGPYLPAPVPKHTDTLARATYIVVAFTLLEIIYFDFLQSVDWFDFILKF